MEEDFILTHGIGIAYHNEKGGGAWRMECVPVRKPIARAELGSLSSDLTPTVHDCGLVLMMSQRSHKLPK